MIKKETNMKTFKNILNIFLLGLITSVVCSCDDEVEYTPAESPTNSQVYFPSSLASNYDLDSGASSFTVEISRVESSSAQTVALTVSDETGKLSVPTSVDFAAGATSAQLVIGYDAAAFEYDVYGKATIKIAETEATPYGNSEYSFTYGVPAPWTDWVLFGTGTYTYTQYWSGDDPDRNVYKRTSKLDPTQSQFMIEGVFYGIEFIVDYNEETHACRISPQYTAYDNSTYGPVYTADAGYYWVDIRQNADASYDQFPSYFNPETGLFELYLAFYVSAGYFGVGYEYLQLNGYEQPDYSLKLSNVGHYVDPTGVDNAVVHIYKGADVASYKCILKEGALSSSAVEAAFEELANGTIEADTLYATGYKAFPLEIEGKYTAVAVGFDANDEVVSKESLTFEFIPVGQSNPWKSLGMCAFTEDCLSTFWSSLENLTYSVEIREHQNKPGLYRLVNPYGAAFPYNEDGDYDASKEYYLEVNAQDPTAVYVELSSTGMNWGYGEVSIWSMASYYMNNGGKTLSEVKEQGFCGTLVDGVITFPVSSLLISMTEYQSGNFYAANKNGAFKIDMTNMTAVEETVDSRSLFFVSKNVESQSSSGIQYIPSDYKKGLSIEGKRFLEQKNQTVK